MYARICDNLSKGSNTYVSLANIADKYRVMVSVVKQIVRKMGIEGKLVEVEGHNRYMVYRVRN